MSYDHLWRCCYCDQHFVVPSLARDHEARCPEAPGGDAVAEPNTLQPKP